MKVSLQNRSLQAAMVAIAVAATSHSAQAALVQINLGGANWLKTINSPHLGRLDITGDGTLDDVQWVSDTAFDSELGYNVTDAYYDVPILNNGSGFYYPDPSPSSFVADETTYFTDLRINFGQLTNARVSFITTDNYITLTRVVFNDASTTDLSGFNNANSYPTFVPASTAVPEPSTFLPAALLVMGALLRRRRGRAYRSGRAAA